MPTNPRRQINETIARLMACQPHINQAIAALTYAQPGYPTNTGGGGSTPQRQDDGHPSGLDRHLFTNDPAAYELRQLNKLLDRILTDATILYDITTRWTANTNTEGGHKQPQQTNNASDCLACGRFVAGTHTDRLRSGLCLACYQDRRRSQLERGDWLIERRRTINEDTTEVA